MLRLVHFLKYLRQMLHELFIGSKINYLSIINGMLQGWWHFKMYKQEISNLQNDGTSKPMM